MAANDLSSVKPRDLLAWRLNQATAAREANDGSREAQLRYRDTLIALHEATAAYFGEQLEQKC